MLRERLTAAIWLGLVTVMLESCAPQPTAAPSVPAVAPRHGTGVVFPADGTRREATSMRQTRSSTRMAHRSGEVEAGNGLFSRFSAGKVPVHRTALRNPHSRTRHAAARPGRAVLYTNPMGAQLGSEPHGWGQQLYCPDLVAGDRPAIHSNPDQSRAALIPPRWGEWLAVRSRRPRHHAALYGPHRSTGRGAVKLRRGPSLRRLPYRTIRCVERVAPRAGYAERHRGDVLGDFRGAQPRAFRRVKPLSPRRRKIHGADRGTGRRSHEYEIAYTFGVYPLQQYLIAFPGGRYQALGIAWDSRPKDQGGQRWFHLYPDQKLPSRRPPPLDRARPDLELSVRRAAIPRI